MALREVLASFGIEVDDGKLKAAAANVQQYENSLRGLVTQEHKATAAALEQANAQNAVVRQLRSEFIVNAAKQVVGAFTGMVESSLALAGNLQDTSDKLGVSTTELQQFQFAGRLAGVSAEEMSSSLGFLNKNLGAAASGSKEQAEAFSKLGIEIKDGNGQLRGSAEILPEVADKIAGMGSQAEKTAAVIGIFGRSGANLLPLFKDGAKGIQAALDKFKELGLEIDKNFIEQADDVGDQVETMHIQFDVLKTKLVASALPALKTLSEVVLKLGAFFGNLLKNTNAAIIVFATFAGGALIALIAGFNALAVAVGLSLGELLLVVAIFALIALVVEDIYTLFTGGDSVIGRFIDSLFGVGASAKFVEEVKVVVKDLWEQLKELWPAVKALGVAIGAAFSDNKGAILDVVKFIAVGMVGGMKILIEVISLVISALGYLFAFWTKGAEVWRGIIAGLKADFEAVVGVIQKVIDGIGKIPGVGGALGLVAGGGPAKTTASGLGAGGGGNNNVSQQNQTTINVNGADQPQSLVGKVSNALADTFEQQKRNALGALSSVF